MNIASKLIQFQNKHKSFAGIISKVLRLIFSCDIPSIKFLGGGTTFEHNALGIVISREVSIGTNCKIYQHVTIGAGHGGYPEIGNNVTIYSNSVIVGNIKIGDNCVIGACSFVNTNVPPNSTFVGIPAKNIK